ncbi:Uncharacterised protein [Escherichia coli]|uniref:Uncharacterized protein n=1 Tax=Escherichia coli TaxID=562 RepID=A0A377D378_ECOLX|nr:Uncharacterised protein [Escherichia coli]
MEAIQVIQDQESEIATLKKQLNEKSAGKGVSNESRNQPLSDSQPTAVSMKSTKA